MESVNADLRKMLVNTKLLVNLPLNNNADEVQDLRMKIASLEARIEEMKISKVPKESPSTNMIVESQV